MNRQPRGIMDADELRIRSSCTMAIRIAIHGAAGRMGQRLVALASADPELKIVAALEHAGASASWARTPARSPASGRSACRCRPRSTGPVDVVIDFSVPAGHRRDPGRRASSKKIPLVVATTGLDADQQAARFATAAATIPAALVAQHEPGGEPGDEAGRDRRPRR